MDKEISSELSMFFGELKSDINSINKQLENHSVKLDAQQEILQQMAKTEVILTNIIEKQSNLNEVVKKYDQKVDQINSINQKKINKLEDDIEKHDRIISILKWGFGIIIAISTAVSISGIKVWLGL